MNVQVKRRSIIEPHFEPYEIVAAAIACTDEYGFTSVGYAKDNKQRATATIAALVLDPERSAPLDVQRKAAYVRKKLDANRHEISKRATDVVRYLQSEAAATTDQKLRELGAAMRDQIPISGANFAFVCAAPYVYGKKTKANKDFQGLYDQLDIVRGRSERVGAVNQYIKAHPVRLLFSRIVRPDPDDIYQTRIYKFADDDENIFATFLTEKLIDAKIADPLWLEGRVSSHQETKDGWETHLAFCKVTPRTVPHNIVPLAPPVAKAPAPAVARTQPEAPRPEPKPVAPPKPKAAPLDADDPELKTLERNMRASLEAKRRPVEIVRIKHRAIPQPYTVPPQVSTPLPATLEPLPFGTRPKPLAMRNVLGAQVWYIADQVACVIASYDRWRIHSLHWRGWPLYAPGSLWLPVRIALGDGARERWNEKSVSARVFHTADAAANEMDKRLDFHPLMKGQVIAMDRDNLLPLVSEIVSAHLSSNTVDPAQLPDMIESVHKALTRIAGKEQLPPVTASNDATPILAPVKERPVTLADELTVKLPILPGAPAKMTAAQSVGKESVGCMACGRRMKLLRRHLRETHGLTPEAYKAIFKLPASHPIAATDTLELLGIAMKIARDANPFHKRKGKGKK